MEPEHQNLRLTSRPGTSVGFFCLCLSFLAYGQRMRGAQAESSKELHKTIPALRAAYAAFNRADFDAAVAPLDPQIEWTEPAEFPGGGTYHGREAVKGYLRQSRAGWAEGTSEPEHFITAGNRIVVFVYARFRKKGSNEWQEVRLADVYTMRAGKIVQMNAFSDRQKALKWAGVAVANE
jgi:ketosteroid isomerase-like protein